MRQDWTDQQLRHGRLADELDKRVKPTAGYFASFQLEGAKRDPSPRRFAEFVEARLEELPPYDQAPSTISEARFEYREEGVRINLWFAPMRPGARALTDPDARITGFGQIVGGFVNSASRLQARLAEKATKLRDVYESHGVPFIVAVGVHDINCSTDEVISALYGSEALIVATGALTRNRDGFFGADRRRPNGRRRSVAGVAVVSGLAPGTGRDPDVGLFHNPFAANPWPPDLMPAVTHDWGVIERTDTSMRLGWTTLP
jgi:hypothetical protein